MNHKEATEKALDALEEMAKKDQMSIKAVLASACMLGAEYQSRMTQEFITKHSPANGRLEPEEATGPKRTGSLNEFHARNVERQHEAFAPAHSLTALVVCVQEEVGELASAVLGVTGEKKRKVHLTNADVLDAVADAMTYLSLVAASVGCDDLEKLLGDTFNMVSERAGSTIRTELGQSAERPGNGGRAI